ncbi:MAG: nicotinamide mononucleotide transporter [Chitinophagaceae bacterium]|nr:nicotinamide mononucleotide transporter [Chitinophagaceae bacterium]MCB9045123.1 nicotinamide mononucleotide transporter [Chitinophagales bacterium]
MSLQGLAYDFTVQLLNTTITEAIAVLFGVASVILANRNNMLLYPTGIISTGLYLYIMSSVGLYAETLLNGYYLVMSIYGWIRWVKNREDGKASAISYCTAKDWIMVGAIVILGFAILYTTLSKYTDSTVPFADALVSAFAWAGMWLLAKHKIENWILLNVSNFIAIPLLVYKGIPMTALLTVILFTVAMFGYFRWRKLYHLQFAQ